MALASSSTSALRASSRMAIPALSGRAVVSRSKKVAVAQAQGYASTATVAAASPSGSTSVDLPPSSASSQRYPRPLTSNTPTSASSAQAYLSDLLALPSDRQFPSELALQMLTHKSYRYAHPIRHLSSARSAGSSEAEGAGGVGSQPHNSRLSFMGRRALSTYLSIFAHDAFAASSIRMKEDGADFLKGLALEDRLDNLRHTNNLGRTVGSVWGLANVVRWDRNEASRESGDLKIRGMAVEAILGGIYMQFGSPAAHRAFHMHVLPHLVPQLRDPRLVERVMGLKGELEGQGRGILRS
ncbi:hypothetical protein IAU60_005209 [Kwoniella sp. DSM 27419]